MALTNAERQKRWRERHKGRDDGAAALQARVAELEAQLAARPVDEDGDDIRWPNLTVLEKAQHVTALVAMCDWFDGASYEERIEAKDYGPSFLGKRLVEWVEEPPELLAFFHLTGIVGAYLTEQAWRYADVGYPPSTNKIIDKDEVARIKAHYEAVVAARDAARKEAAAREAAAAATVKTRKRRRSGQSR